MLFKNFVIAEEGEVEGVLAQWYDYVKHDAPFLGPDGSYITIIRDSDTLNILCEKHYPTEESRKQAFNDLVLKCKRLLKEGGVH